MTVPANGHGSEPSGAGGGAGVSVMLTRADSAAGCRIRGSIHPQQAEDGVGHRPHGCGASRRAATGYVGRRGMAAAAGALPSARERSRGRGVWIRGRRFWRRRARRRAAQQPRRASFLVRSRSRSGSRSSRDGSGVGRRRVPGATTTTTTTTVTAGAAGGGGGGGVAAQPSAPSPSRRRGDGRGRDDWCGSCRRVYRRAPRTAAAGVALWPRWKDRRTRLRRSLISNLSSGGRFPSTREMEGDTQGFAAADIRVYGRRHHDQGPVLPARKKRTPRGAEPVSHRGRRTMRQGGEEQDQIHHRGGSGQAGAPGRLQRGQVQGVMMMMTSHVVP